MGGKILKPVRSFQIPYPQFRATLMQNFRKKIPDLKNQSRSYMDQLEFLTLRFDVFWAKLIFHRWTMIFFRPNFFITHFLWCRWPFKDQKIWTSNIRSRSNRYTTKFSIQVFSTFSKYFNTWVINIRDLGIKILMEHETAAMRRIAHAR